MTATSSNTTAVPNANITVTGSGTASANVKIQSAAMGYSDITVTVSDDSGNNATFVINYAASAAGMATSHYHSGKADASTAIAVDTDYMLVADDEDQTIRLYNRTNSGLPVNSFDLTSSLGLTDLSGGIPREVDIEGSAQSGSDIYWLASHSNSSSGSSRPNRYRLIRTTVSGSGASSAVIYTSHYSNLRTDLISWGNTHGYDFTASSATGKIPEDADKAGFNIEGFTIAPDGTTAFIGFRAPQVPTAGRVKALIAPVANFISWASSDFTSPAVPTLGSPIELDLGGRGIRSIECSNANGCLIIAGASDGTGNFKLYRWSGNAADAPVLMSTDLSTTAITGGGNNGSFESIVQMPAGAMNTWAGQTIQLLLDNGDTIYYGDGVIAKDLPQANHKKFRSQTVTLTEPTITKIHDIQGSSATFNSVFGGAQTIEGIVTRAFQGSTKLNGFYVQEEGADADADSATSEAIFVYDSSGLFTGSVGDKVQVTGTVSEYTSSSSSLTEITATSVTNLGASTLPAVTNIQLPVANVSDLERYEGMLVNVSAASGNLVVTENYQLGQYGQIVLAATSRLVQYTHANAPSTSGYTAHLADIAKRKIYLDDGSGAQNPDPVIHARGGNPLSASNTLRSGDTVASVTGILDHRYEGYRIQTTTGVNFTAANARTATAPSVGSANVKVASFNLLNYFNTFTNCSLGVGGATATSNCRGAENATEFTRQKDKHKKVFEGLNADVIGLMELENDGYGGASAQQDLLSLVNSIGLTGRNYAMVDADALIGSTNALGADAIKVGLIYDDTALDLVPGSVKTSPNAIFDRNPLAATFIHTATGQKFTVVVNHLKSKGSSAGGTGDSDAGDGQGLSNGTRVAQAQALVTFLGILTDDPDILVIGDMNSYAMENPIATIKAAGYTDLLGSTKYSYVYDGQIGYLDHALASASLVTQVTGADDWHINADEPSVLDYNTNYKSAAQISGFYNADAYRASDHDPVLIGLSLGSTPLLSQTISSVTFNPATLTVGGVTTVSASASSGLPVTFSSISPTICSVSGTTVTGVTAGTCTIAANQVGNANYSAAPQVTGNITVLTPSTVDVRGNNQTIVNGDVTPALIDNTDWGTVTLGQTAILAFAIHNTGGVPLSVNSVTVTPNRGFSLAQAPATQVAAGQSIPFSLQFSPPGSGLFQATITVASDAANANPYSFMVQGRGSSLIALPYPDGNGDTIPDDQQTAVESVVGSIGQVVIASSNPADNFQVVTVGSEASGNRPDDSGYLYPAGMVSFTVAVTPPGATRIFKFYFYGLTSTTGLSARKFGPTPDNQIPHWYDLPAAVQPVLAVETVNGQAVVTLAFTITDGGIGDSDLIANGIITDPVGPAMVGGNPPPPTPASFGATPASGTPLDLGAIPVGGSANTLLTVYNRGGDALSANLALSGSNASDFQVWPPRVYLPGGSAPINLTVTCAPSASGLRIANLSIAHNAGAPANYPLTCTGQTATPPPGSDIVLLQTQSPALIGAGAGDDTYILSPSLLTASRSFTLTDTQGGNRIQLVGGLAITTAQVAKNALRLTLGNGALIDVLDADGFRYEVCGNATAGVSAPSVTFAVFALNTLGVTVPTASGVIAQGGPITIACP